jgi:hypothetical protein
VGTFQRLLLAIRRHPRWSWVGLAVFAAAVTFPHESVQYVVNLIANRFTHKRVYQGSAAIALFEVALLTFIVVKRLIGQAERRRLGAFWILTVLLIWGTWRVFTANNVELVHYPQYFPEGIALAALTLSPAESLAWVALFGGLDECFQYWHLMGDKLVPFDFNDIYMDLLGGAAGVLFALAFLRCEMRQPDSGSTRSIFSRPGIIAILSVAAMGIVLWALGMMQLYEDNTKPHHWFALSRGTSPAFWVVVRANGPHAYHTLSPIEGPILILATIALFGTLDRRLLISAPS